MTGLWLAALLAGCAPKAPQRDKAVRPALTTAETLRAALAPRRRAILFGVEQYADPAFPPLRHAEEDAAAIAALLENPEQGGFDEVFVYRGADRATIARALQQARADLAREDTLVVYFSGHGTADSAGSRYLLAADSQARDLPGTALELTALQDFFSALAPAQKALIVDACFSGDGKSSRPPDAAPLSAADPLVSARAASMTPGEAHLFATSAGRPAREDDQLGHGVYTWYLLDALSWSFAEADRDQDGVVTAYEAHDHARGRTIARTGGVQVPEATFRIVGEGDLVLVGQPDARVRRSQALVYLYPPTGHDLHGATILVDGQEKGVLPGTVAVPAGVHSLRLLGADGTLLTSGAAELRGGQVYPADALARMVRGPSAAVSVEASAVYAPALMGGALHTGGAIRLEDRDNEGSRRGLLRAITLGAALDPARTRSSAWAELALGVQHDRRRFRYEATGALALQNLSPEDQTDALGWVFLTAGPQVGVGWVGSETWSLSLRLSAQAGYLDIDQDGAPSGFLAPRASIGGEWSF